MKSGTIVRSATTLERISTKMTSCAPGHTAALPSIFLSMRFWREGTTVDGEQLFDISDPRSEFETEVIHKFYMDDFKGKLFEVDGRILQMCYDGNSLKEVATAVGFKTPSTVSKHIENIAERYEDFVSDEYSAFLDKHCQ